MWSCLPRRNKAKTRNENKGAFHFLPKSISFSSGSSECKKWHWSTTPLSPLRTFFWLDKVQLAQRERNWVKQKILEALYIQTTANTCNLNSGMKFDENWLTFFQFFSSLPFSWIFFPLIFFNLYFHAFSYCCFACFSQFPIWFCDRAW